VNAEDGIWFSAQKVPGHHFIIPLFMELGHVPGTSQVPGTCN